MRKISMVDTLLVEETCNGRVEPSASKIAEKMSSSRVRRTNELEPLVAVEG